MAVAGAAVLQAGCNAPAPNLLPWDGIYHPQAAKIYHDVEEYRRDFARRTDLRWLLFSSAVTGCGAIPFLQMR